MSTPDGPDAPVTSRYLEYLPAVLWGSDTAGGFTLGSFLKAFETVLSTTDAAHSHPALADTIGATSTLFDPWRTPQQFLRWLASLAALDFPSTGGADVWDAYQQRNATAAIALIHRQHGLQAGLAHRLASSFAGWRYRPRIAVDDGAGLLVVTPGDGQLPSFTTLGARRPAVEQPITWGQNSPIDREVYANGLVRPVCLAAGPAGTLFVGDAGAPELITSLPSTVWHVEVTGRPVAAPGTGDQAGAAITQPRPLAPGTAFSSVVALAYAPATDDLDETLYILDKSSTDRSITLYALSPLNAETARAVGGSDGPDPILPIVEPVAMAVDGDGRILVLDRGVRLFGGASPAPAVVTVTPHAEPAPFTVAPAHALGDVHEPLCLHVQADDTLLVGDGWPGGDGDTLEPEQVGRRGNIVHVDRTGPWTTTRLLPDDGSPVAGAGHRDETHPGENPLIAPTGLTRGQDGTLYVLDAGLRPLRLRANNPDRDLAEPACVYRLPVPASGAPLTALPRPAVARGRLVTPLGMVGIGAHLVVCDAGSLDIPNQDAPPGTLPRVAPHRFSVVVHFSLARLPDAEPDRRRLKRSILSTVADVVTDNLPAHTIAYVVPPVTSVPRPSDND